MTITAYKIETVKRASRELWHRKFIFRATVQLEGRGGRYVVRFETVLRRWSKSKKRWLYLRLTPSRQFTLIGTDKRIESHGA